MWRVVSVVFQVSFDIQEGFGFKLNSSNISSGKGRISPSLHQDSTWGWFKLWKKVWCCTFLQGCDCIRCVKWKQESRWLDSSKTSSTSGILHPKKTGLDQSCTVLSGNETKDLESETRNPVVSLGQVKELIFILFQETRIKNVLKMWLCKSILTTWSRVNLVQLQQECGDDLSVIMNEQTGLSLLFH